MFKLKTAQQISIYVSEATLCFCACQYEELVHGGGCSHPAAPKARERRGRNRWNAAACLQASWYLSMTELTVSPNRPEGTSRGSMRKTLSFSFMSGSNSSSYWGDWGGESSSMPSTSASSEEDRWSVEPSPRGEETAERASDPRELALDLVGEEEERDSPVSIPSTRSICDPHECSRRSALAEAGPAPRGMLVKAPSSKRAFWEGSILIGKRSQCGQSAPSRACVLCNMLSVFWQFTGEICFIKVPKND